MILIKSIMTLKKKLLLKNELKSEFKPGPEGMMKEIFKRTKLKSKLPEVSDLLPMYSLLEKLKY